MVGWHHRLDGHGFGWTQDLVMDREAWRAAVYGVIKSWTRLSDSTELINCWWKCKFVQPVGNCMEFPQEPKK